MKNLKIYKSALAILLAGSFVLLSACSKKNQNGSKSCQHLTVYFEDQPVTFKECDGYDISYSSNNGRLIYWISKNDISILDGSTNQYNIYEVYHNEADKLIDKQSVQKTK